jgi:hypothetical protein
VTRRVGFDQRRLLLVAPGLDVGAARREPAAGRRRDQIGRATADHGQPGVAGVLDPGHRLEQRLGVGHAHLGEERRRGRLLDDLAGVHHGDVVGAAGDHAEVVAHEHHGHVALAPLLVEQVEDLRLHRDVERGGGLVGEQQLGAARQGDGDDDALAHAARQLVRELTEPALGLGDVHRAQQVDRRVAGRGPVEVGVDLERLDDLAPDAHHGVERRHRVLEDHRHLRAPVRPQGGVVEPVDALTLEGDLARPLGGGRQQPHDRAGQHRLAAARLAHQPERAPAGERERHPVDRGHDPAGGPELRAQVGHVEQVAPGGVEALGGGGDVPATPVPSHRGRPRDAPTQGQPPETTTRC